MGAVMFGGGCGWDKGRGEIGEGGTIDPCLTDVPACQSRGLSVNATVGLKSMSSRGCTRAWVRACVHVCVRVNMCLESTHENPKLGQNQLGRPDTISTMEKVEVVNATKLMLIYKGN